MARKAATAKTVDVDDLLDGMTKTDDGKKKKSTYTVEVTDLNIIKKLETWETQKNIEVDASAKRVAVEGDLGAFATAELAKEIARSGKHMASITLAYTEDDVRSEINITANKNQWSTIKAESIPDLKDIFKTDFDTYFEKDRTITMNATEVLKSPSVIQDILAKVFDGDKDKFAKFFSVDVVYKVKPSLGEAQYINEDVTAKIAAAKAKALIAQYKPAFSLKQ
jgi:hypothetical protein